MYICATSLLQLSFRMNTLAYILFAVIGVMLFTLGAAGSEIVRLRKECAEQHSTVELWIGYVKDAMIKKEIAQRAFQELQEICRVVMVQPEQRN